MSGESNFFGAAPAGQPAAAPAPVTVQAPASQTPSVAPASDSSSHDDLVSALRHELAGRFGDPSARVSNELPAGLVTGQPAPAQVDQQAQPPDANSQISAIPGEEPNRETAETTDDVALQTEEAQEKELTAIHLAKFGRDFSLSEIEAALEGFNYYHPKAMKLQEDIQRLQAGFQELEQLKTSPEMQLATMLKADPVLKERFRQIAHEHNPGQLQGVEENQQISALKSEIEQLKGLVNQTQEAEQAREADSKRQAQERHFATVTRAIDDATSSKLEQLKQNGVEISEQEIELVCQNAIANVQAGKLKYDAQSMVGYFNHMFDLIAGKAVQARQQGIQGYRQQKQNLPPPPPSGGSAPVIAPDSPKNFNDMQSVLTNRLEAVLNQM